MVNYFMKRYALSQKGAKDFIKAVIWATIADIALMMPISIAYFVVSDLLNGGISTTGYWVYSITTVLALVLIYFLNLLQYDAEFGATYKESERRRISLAERLRKLPLSYFGKKDVGDLTKVILSDTTLLEQNFSHIMPQFYGSIISTTIVVISLFGFDWRMTLASIWVFPVAMLIVFTSKKLQDKVNKPKLAANVECEANIHEYIETIKDYKANAAEDRMLVPIKKSIKKCEKTGLISEIGVAAFVISAQMILKIGIATTALVGGYLIAKGMITLPVFFMYLIVVSRIYEPMSGALVNLAAIINQELTIERTRAIQEYPIQTGDTNVSVDNYDIEFKDVKFAYNENEGVLNGVSLVAKQGEVTALVGPSGGGKSTIGKLAARFYDANSGEILLGGKDISKIDPEELLKNYSIVFQDVVLFNNTIKENIRIGKSDATDEEVIWAAKEARCDEFISRLPYGIDTMIGENGAYLSGGERQRISIARALLKNAPIILLDEATASLDAENETEIQQAISKLTKNKTVVIIAHRMRTVENADKVVYIANGKIVEQGAPSELLKNNNTNFAKMVETQKQSADWKI